MPKGVPDGLRNRYPREYNSWKSMKQRCNNPKAAYYHRYGQRGIKVHEDFETFWGFLSYIGERPENTSLDRIDVDADYAPGNVRWASPSIQSEGRAPYKHDRVRGSITVRRSTYEDRAGFQSDSVSYVVKLRDKYVGSSTERSVAEEMLKEALENDRSGI